MKDNTDNEVVVLSKAYAVRIVNLYKFLSNERKEFVLSKQLLRAGTSVGANVHEAIRGQSKADFIAKMAIALKEASESEYWLDLLFATAYLSDTEYNSLKEDNNRLIRILTSIIKTAKK